MMQNGSIFFAAFLGSFVEFVEALTIVLAVGSTRGWRHSLNGALFGVIFLAILVTFFGAALQQIPLEKLQVVIGVLLLLFGLKWLRKAVLRSAGILPLHDEAKIYSQQSKELQSQPLKAGFFSDPVAIVTSFKAVVLEGLEVVFIIIATGAASHSVKVASLGASLAAVIVIGLGFLIHKPLSQIPENTLKFSVGVLLTSFGTFWTGEGLGVQWPQADLFLIVLVGAFLGASLLTVKVLKKTAPSP